MFALVVLTWTGWGGAPFVTEPGATSPTVASGVVCGLFVAGAAFAGLVSVRRQSNPLSGWAAALGPLVAGQALLVALPAVSHPPQTTAERVVIALAAVIGTVLVVGAVTGLLRLSSTDEDSFGISLGMGFVAAGYLLLLVPMDGPSADFTKSLVVLLGGTHLIAAAAVIGNGLPRRVAWLLLATVVVVATGLGLAVAGQSASAWSQVLVVALAAVGATWSALAWEGMQAALRRRAWSMGAAEHARAAALRDQRERLHELRSTVAGLVNGSELIDREDIGEATRARLWESVRRELERMQRLLSEEQQAPTHLDLDESLTLMTDLQRLKGRHVELRTNGELVRARYDSLAEVVNILMDNAATHGGSDSSLVEVARRDEETVDITVTDFGRGIAEEDREAIFEWGRRGPDSPGEGIGLSVAQRLVAEEGGSLELAEAADTGSSFVISLPSPRRSPEDLADDDGQEAGHGTWRRSS